MKFTQNEKKKMNKQKAHENVPVGICTSFVGKYVGAFI